MWWFHTVPKSLNENFTLSMLLREAMGVERIVTAENVLPWLIYKLTPVDLYIIKKGARCVPVTYVSFTKAEM